METRHVEIARFAKRAADYKRAISLAPEARVLEIGAVVSIVAGLCRGKGWDRSTVHIVDLMAGSGILTRALRTAGFGRVTPIEACGEMRPDDSKMLGYLNGQEFAHLKTTLLHLKPDIVVSLAAFHHLLEYAGTEVDRAASMAYQLEVADACVSAVTPGGYLVIVDISEVANLAPTKVAPIDAWESTGVFTTNILSGDEIKVLERTTSIAHFSQAADAMLGPVDKNIAVQWFRRVVDIKTKLGHKDCAISESLFRLMAMRYGVSVQASSFSCPWLFPSSEVAEQFVMHKFGFLVDRDHETNADAIRKDMSDYLGHAAAKPSRVALRWALCGVVVRHEPTKENFDMVPLVNIILMIAVVLVIVRAWARLAGVGDSIDETLSGAFWMACGAAGGIAIELVKKSLPQSIDRG